MALHGQIQVNGTSIGSWSARRTEPLDGRVGFYAYECEVIHLSSPREGAPVRSTFTVEHCYEDGAARLAAAVLTRACKEF